MRALPPIKIAHRFRIAYLLFLLPLIYLTAALANSVLTEVRLVERELAGARFGAALRGLQDDAQRHRSETQPNFSPTAFAREIARAHSAYGSGLAMDPAVAGAVEALSAASAPFDGDAPRVVLELIATLVDQSGLSLDSQLDSYYLIEALLVQLPELVDRMGRAGGSARDLLRADSGNEGLRAFLQRERSRITTLIDHVRNALDRAAAAARPSNRTDLADLARLYRLTEIQQFEDLLDDVARGVAPATNLDATFLQAFDAIERLRVNGAATLESLLTKRLDASWRTLELHAAITGLLFVVGAVFLFFALERGTLRPIRSITALMRQLAGEADGETQRAPRDEIGAMFHALGVFRENARQNVAEERALRVRQEALVQITQAHLIGRSTLERTLDAITQTASEALGADRVVVVSAPTAGAPLMLSRYSGLTRSHDERVGATGIAVGGNFPATVMELMPTLDEKLVVAIEDVATDERLPLEARNWLMEQDAQSFVIAKVSVPGVAPGYVTFVSLGRMRHWQANDMAFARAVADLVAFAFLDHNHRQALVALDLVDEGLSVANAAGEIVYANRTARQLARAEGDAAIASERMPTLPGVTGDADGECVWDGRDGVVLNLEIARRVTPDHNVVTVMRDVTTLKRQERERQALEAELRQAAKMEAIGRLAGGIAHDFNNVLGTMIGYTGFLLEDLPADSRNWEHARRLMRAADHAKELVRQILTYAREEKTKRRIVDLSDSLGEIASLVRASLPASTRIDFDRTTEPAPVLVNESEIFQIILNLCINANDAFEDAPGHIAISLARAASTAIDNISEEPADWARVTGGRLAPGQPYICLKVVDDGAGMDQKTLSRIFEPFFTTKERGRGTGLGLAVVHGIIIAHEGAYLVESRIGGGTSFNIYLPVNGGAAEQPAAEFAAPPPTGHESVLVIDDDGDLLEMMMAGLERLGYAVTGTDNPNDALESVIADPGSWEVVVSDHVMPGMKGLALLTEMKRVRPELPVILCTGYSDNLTEAQAQEVGVDAFFLKPVEPATIARQIRILLDR